WNACAATRARRPSKPTVLDIVVATRNERGQRERNEDRVRVSREGARWIAILADGAGGHRGGAEASGRAVDALEAALQEAGADFSAAALTRAVLSAHAQVQRAQRESEASLARMHSTIVVLWVDTER